MKITYSNAKFELVDKITIFIFWLTCDGSDHLWNAC